MPLSHWPNGISSFGCPVMPAFPFSGDSNYYYVDAVNGNDGNSGTDPSQAYASIAKAYAQLRAGHYDTVFVIGLATANVLTAPLVWAKDFTNLIGLCSGVTLSQRARITNGVTLMTPLLTVSASGCTFMDLQFANFGNSATAAAVCALVSGQRNYFSRCQFAGGGSTAARGNAAMRSLVVGGASNGENYFDHCTIGLDTILGGNVANAEIELVGGSPRNIFDTCDIIKNGTGAELFLLIGADGIDRFVEFKNCTFNNYTGGGGGSLTNATSINAAAGGQVLMRNCLFIGASAIPASSVISADPTAASTVILKGLSPT